MCNIRKTAFCILTLMLLSMASVSAYAAETAVSIGSVNEIKPGEIFTVDIDIENAPDMYGFNFKIGFDNKYISPESVTKGANFKGFSLMANTSENDTRKDLLDSVIVNGDAVDPIAANGTVCTVTFKVKEAAKDGSIALTIDDFLMINEDLEDIPAKVTNGIVGIIDGALIGDMDLDGNITDDDAAQLMKALSDVTSKEELVNHGNVDSTDDGFNLLDVIYILNLRKH